MDSIALMRLYAGYFFSFHNFDFVLGVILGELEKIGRRTTSDKNLRKVVKKTNEKDKTILSVQETF